MANPFENVGDPLSRAALEELITPDACMYVLGESYQPSPRLLDDRPSPQGNPSSKKSAELAM